MNEKLSVITGLPLGFLLGLFFYGGLKLTLKKGLSSGYPALWFLLSFLLRTGIVVAGFYYFSGGNWKILLTCLAGFSLSRFAVTGAKSSMLPQETDKILKDENHSR